MAGLLWAFLPSDLTALITQYIADRFLKFIFQLPYSRQLEREADVVGIQLAARVSLFNVNIGRKMCHFYNLNKACFDVRCAVPFWNRMDEHDTNYKVPEFLSTHPGCESRAADLEKLMPEALELRNKCNCQSLPEASKDNR